jgi:hypothetical protein
MQGTSLGDDTLSAMAMPAPAVPAVSVAEAADNQWKADMLSGQRSLIAAQKTWAEGDHFQKWVQIAVTASIPLFGAAWRALGIGRKKKR